MAIEITQTSEDKIYVNNKLVYRDMDGNWNAKIELTNNEETALNTFLHQKKRSADGRV